MSTSKVPYVMHANQYKGIALLAASITCAPFSAVAASTGASTANDRNTLEYVVVTAQKREERLIDTPISIGVLSGGDLDLGSSRSVADVLAQVGGVTVIEAKPGDTQIFIRGVAPSPNIGTATAGFYLDEVPFNFVTTAQLPDLNAYDLARVEVLRGPQGTLYGASALSGVVRVLTNDANLQAFEAKGRARLSDTTAGGNGYNGDFAVNVPLIVDKLAVRGVVSNARQSGFIDSAQTGEQRINDFDGEAYRLKFLYKASEALSVTLGASRSEIDNGAPSLGTDDFTTLWSGNQSDERIYDTYNLIAQYDFAAGSLTSSSSYVDYDIGTVIEDVFSGAPLFFFAGTGLRSFAQELRFASALSGPWQYTAGAIYKDTDEDILADANLFPAPYQARNHSESFALFGELSRSFDNGRFELTAGIRYFEDDVLNTQQSDFSGGAVSSPLTAKFDRVTGRVVFAFKPSNDRLFYASVASGFRSGANQNFAVAALAPDLAPLGPDTLVNYEFGTKGALIGGALIYESTVYYIDWEDIQQRLLLPPPLTFNAYVNAGGASGFGADTSLYYQLSESFTLQANVGWNDLSLTEDVFNGTTVLFEEGARVNSSPEWLAFVGGSYRAPSPIGEVDLVLSGSYGYRSEVLGRRFDTTVGTSVVESESDTTQIVKASIGVAGNHWSVELYGDNLLDEDGAVTERDTFGLAVRLRPRTIGLQVAFSY